MHTIWAINRPSALVRVDIVSSWTVRSRAYADGFLLNEALASVSAACFPTRFSRKASLLEVVGTWPDLNSHYHSKRFLEFHGRRASSAYKTEEEKGRIRKFPIETFRIHTFAARRSNPHFPRLPPRRRWPERSARGTMQRRGRRRTCVQGRTSSPRL